jgi:hypothetical protein
MKISHETKCFLASFFTTLCVILLIAGLVAADCNSRRVGFGVDDPVACIVQEGGRTELRIHALGVKKSMDLTAAEETARQAQRVIWEIAREGEKMFSG